VKQGALVIDFGVFFLEDHSVRRGSAPRRSRYFYLSNRAPDRICGASLLIRSILPERNHMFEVGDH